MKADGERSLKALRDSVARYHGGIIVLEVSARGESQSNGIAEQAAQVVAEFVRVLKEQIEVKTKMKLSPEDTISLWMVRWASILCSKYMVGADGRTPYERRRGRRCRMPVVRFSERVLFKQIREGKNCRDKFESEDREGVWLGHNREANEVLIGKPSTDAEVRVQMGRGLDQKHAGHAEAARPDKTWSRNTDQGSIQ